ncbi:MAG TPA: OmpH family outer membrane protein [Candidatus Sumerlaeota bacterium]|nr:MAG: Outer membrane protein (OmpH-like) [candidate division BRC1 bacterium ADurb.BinA292]HOE95686.1 OmpH family outer membrane protein [Candidatus Sumerlaeota bacterium]HOR26997.1 OmpH family outer membrane protein [Candidatus Sumerlaeota bacterium]HPK02396.1 OmpH family outer membrane protein [Candidatus Sumerlaeota bacterium]
MQRIQRIPASSRTALLLLALPVVILSLAAARTEPTAVGVVDVDLVRERSAHVQAQLRALASPVQQIQDSLKAKQAELQQLLSEYAAQQSAATEEVNQRRVERIREVSREAEELSRQFEDAWNQAEQAGLAPLRDTIFAAVEQEAAARGMRVILRSDSVVYMDDAQDITQAVVSRLDANR